MRLLTLSALSILCGYGSTPASDNALALQHRRSLSEVPGSQHCLHSTDLVPPRNEKTGKPAYGKEDSPATEEMQSGGKLLRRTLSVRSQQTAPTLTDTARCYASQVKKTLKRRDPSLPSSTVEMSSDDIVAHGVGISSDYFGDTERVYLNVICYCNTKPSLPSDGNYAASLIHLSEVECSGLVPNTRVSYNLTDPGTCFAGSVRQSYQSRGSISRLFLDTDVGNKTGMKAGEKTVPIKLNVRESADLIFGAGEFRLGQLGYYSVCNKDIRIQSTDHVNLLQSAKRIAHDVE